MTAAIVRPYCRWMILRDYAQVLAIEAASFGCRTWTGEDYYACLRQRNCIGMVAEQDDRVLGVMLYDLFPHHLHLIRFAVHPEYRRGGVGTNMLAKLVSKLSSHRRKRITIEVPETYLPALLFFKSMSFTAVEVRRDAFGTEDAILMEYRL